MENYKQLDFANKLKRSKITPQQLDNPPFCSEPRGAKLAPSPYEKMEGPGKSGNEYKKKP